MKYEKNKIYKIKTHLIGERTNYFAWYIFTNDCLYSFKTLKEAKIFLKLNF